jgi:uncharacterized protein
MSARAAIAWLAVVLGLFVGGHSLAEVPVPPLEARVTDLTATLSDEQRRALEYKLAGFEERKGSQIAVLLVPTTQPETIEQYSMRVAQQWKLGRKGVDDGALLLIAKDDRALRLEVGYGLEGVLPDVTARRIVDEIIVPRFRDGDFSGGIDAGVDAMVKRIEGEPLPAPTWPILPPTSRFDRYGTVLALTIILLLAEHGHLRSMVGRLPAAIIVSGAIGVSIWWVAQTFIGALVVALALFVITLLSRSSTSQDTIWNGPYRPGSGLGWGGRPGGFGGGFGGGGGGFGGGGFSGRW